MRLPPAQPGGLAAVSDMPTRHGLAVLLGGALAVFMVIVLTTPAMEGLGHLPGLGLGGSSSGTREAERPRVPPPMTPAVERALRHRVVMRAASQVGVSEIGGDSNYAPAIVRYRKAVIGPGEDPHSREPWCADFVSWAWRSAGLPISFAGRGADYVPTLVAWARFTGRWHDPGSGYRPQPGDLAVFSEYARYGHVGMVAALNGGQVRTIDGNYSDRVMRRSTPAGSSAISGYIDVVG